MFYISGLSVLILLAALDLDPFLKMGQIFADFLLSGTALSRRLAEYQCHRMTEFVLLIVIVTVVWYHLVQALYQICELLEVLQECVDGLQ